MSLFILACAGLILFSAIFILIPMMQRAAREQSQQAANLAWFQLRRRELAEQGVSDLDDDVQLRLLEDDASAEATGSPVSTSNGFPLWVLIPVVTVAAVLLYQRLGAAPDVVIAAKLMSIDDSSSADDMTALMLAIEERSAQRPDNLHYQALLGRYFMGQQDYGRASQLYQRLLNDAPDDAQALAYAAQAAYLANERQLDDSARMLAERSLAVDPHQRTALGLLGMASFEQGSYRAAIEYWERLLATEARDSEGARMISGVIDMARQALAEESGEAVAEVGDTGATADAVSPGVSVVVTMPEDAQYQAADTVFVLARSAAPGSRMPIAVQRFSAAQLPLELRLDDQNSMAGQKLSEAGEVIVAVQVSPSGQPGKANASYLGQAGPLMPSTSLDPLIIQLEPRSN